MNGPTATQRLRENGVVIPIIGVTGNVLADDVNFFLKNGADLVLAKPLSKQIIQQTICDMERYIKTSSTGGGV